MEPSARTRATDPAIVHHDWFCLDCHYCLRGLTEARCPECGKPFAPGNPKTYDVGKPMSPFVRRCFRPPGRPMFTMTAFASLLMVCGAAVPGMWPLVLILGFLAWEITGAVWLVRVFARGVLRTRYPDPAWAESPSRWRIPPILACLTIGAAAAQIPLYVGFLISKPAMDRLQRQVSPMASNASVPDQWIGIYPATRVRVVQGGLRFSVGLPGEPEHGAGFAFLPSGTRPPGSIEPSYRRLFGNWFVFVWTEGSISFGDLIPSPWWFFGRLY